MPRARSSAIAGLAAIVMVGAIAAGGCSSGEAPPPTTVPPRPGGVGRLGTTIAPATNPPGAGTTPGTATISRFDVPASVSCAPGGTADLRAGYETDGTRVVFTVDNVVIAGEPTTSGSFTIPLPCDGNVHTVVLSTFDADGRSTVQSRAVLTDNGGG